MQQTSSVLSNRHFHGLFSFCCDYNDRLCSHPPWKIGRQEHWVCDCHLIWFAVLVCKLVQFFCPALTYFPSALSSLRWRRHLKLLQHLVCLCVLVNWTFTRLTLVSLKQRFFCPALWGVAMAAMYGDFSHQSTRWWQVRKIPRSKNSDAHNIRLRVHTSMCRHCVNASCSLHSENKLGVNYPSVVEMQRENQIARQKCMSCDSAQACLVCTVYADYFVVFGGGEWRALVVSSACFWGGSRGRAEFSAWLDSRDPPFHFHSGLWGSRRLDVVQRENYYGSCWWVFFAGPSEDKLYLCTTDELKKNESLFWRKCL